jgi:hypothetical protein
MLTRGGDEDGEDKGYLCGGDIRSFFKGPFLINDTHLFSTWKRTRVHNLCNNRYILKEWRRFVIGYEVSHFMTVKVLMISIPP